MTSNPFQKASRRRVKLKIGLQGPAGSGKTEGALNMATQMLAELEARGMLEKRKEGHQIAVLDTENDTASLYADRFDFDTVCLYPPYTSERYIELMKAAVQHGYQILIIDSLSHQWAGDGGILQRKEEVDARGGNHFSNWQPFTKEHNAFVATLLNLPVHVIGTLRSKVAYQVTEGSGNKKGSVKKLGTAPITREGLDYEFSLILELQLDNRALSGKDRTGLFPPSTTATMNLRQPDVAKQLVSWLAAGGQQVESAGPGDGKSFPGDPAAPASMEERGKLEALLDNDLITAQERQAVREVMAGSAEKPFSSRKALAWAAKLEQLITDREVEATAGKAAQRSAASSESTAAASPSSSPTPRSTNGSRPTATDGSAPSGETRESEYAGRPAALDAPEEDPLGLLGETPAEAADPDSETSTRADIVALLSDKAVPERARQLWGELYHGTRRLDLDTLHEIRGKLRDAAGRGGHR